MSSHVDVVLDGFEVRVVFGARIPRLLRHDAFTFRNVIRVADPVSIPAALVCHEMTHIRQQHDVGLWRFAARYLWQLIRHGYEGISYEEEAYARQSNPETVKGYAAITAEGW